ncbi:MAG: hypothetical protein ACQESR_00130 [Planctomycetota bacterium]
MERCPTQAVLPLVGLAAENVIRDRYITGCKILQKTKRLQGNSEWAIQKATNCT